MEYNLDTFATWLREDMSLADDIEIFIDRAAIPNGRKQRPTTRWDHLAKQQSFSMPKVPSRRRLGDRIDEIMAGESSPIPTRMIKQTSFCLPRDVAGSRLGDDGDDDIGRPRMGMKQTSLSSLPRQTSFKNLTEDEQMEMPRLVMHSSFKGLPRGLCDAGQSIGSRPCMSKQDSFSLPHRPSQPHRLNVSSFWPEQNHVNLSNSDATTDTLSSMPRLVKQTSFSLPHLPSQTQGLSVSSGWPEQNHVNYSNSEATTDTLSSMPRLVKQTSFTVARLSSRGPLIGDDEKEGNGNARCRQKQKSVTMPKRPIRTLDSEDKLYKSSTNSSKSISASDAKVVSERNQVVPRSLYSCQ
jgi:hypothetical protein